MKAEGERDSLQKQPSTDSRALDKVAAFLPRAIERYEKLVNDLENVTLRDVTGARHQIKLLVGGEIRLVPTGDYLIARRLSHSGDERRLRWSC